jgi:hypothetical protein
MSTLTLTIGRRYTLAVASLDEASAMYGRLRDESGEGGSTWPIGRLSDGHYISYNGRVWFGDPRAWNPGDVPVREASY